MLRNPWDGQSLEPNALDALVVLASKPIPSFQTLEVNEWRGFLE